MSVERLFRGLSLLMMVLFISLLASSILVGDGVGRLFNFKLLSWRWILGVLEVGASLPWFLLALAVVAKIARFLLYAWGIKGRCDFKVVIARHWEGLLKTCRMRYSSWRRVLTLVIAVGFLLCCEDCTLYLLGLTTIEEAVYRLAVASIAMAAPLWVLLYIHVFWRNRDAQ